MSRAEREKGLRAERDVVRYLRTWWPHAERAVRTGYRTSTRDSADPGDISGTPGIAWQVTDRADLEQDAVLTRRLDETEAQRVAAGADLGLLVQRRRGVSDPGRWWVWMDAGQFADLCYADHVPDRLGWPIRTELRHVVPLLVQAGYGTGEA